MFARLLLLGDLRMRREDNDFSGRRDVFRVYEERFLLFVHAGAEYI